MFFRKFIYDNRGTGTALTGLIIVVLLLIAFVSMVTMAEYVTKSRVIYNAIDHALMASYGSVNRIDLADRNIFIEEDMRNSLKADAREQFEEIWKKESKAIRYLTLDEELGVSSFAVFNYDEDGRLDETAPAPHLHRITSPAVYVHVEGMIKMTFLPSIPLSLHVLIDVPDIPESELYRFVR
ncbi:hypothetical protein F9B85_10530 [Heliorestis acidaminivorans]|uniref:Uncharacterized protein n=1 Tax=Heliorestis acidaminivorans TaxID=553427 RepID=A0A6I0EXM9_9FIRM|nr:hypothetical protein [Heliorestis acidaminivorans]KAB2951983.1 hypothetical protein F9B85_10530 [Heliorestis acidaminivorans]